MRENRGRIVPNVIFAIITVRLLLGITMAMEAEEKMLKKSRDARTNYQIAANEEQQKMDELLEEFEKRMENETIN